MGFGGLVSGKGSSEMKNLKKASVKWNSSPEKIVVAQRGKYQRWAVPAHPVAAALLPHVVFGIFLLDSRRPAVSDPLLVPRKYPLTQAGSSPEVLQGQERLGILLIRE